MGRKTVLTTRGRMRSLLAVCMSFVLACGICFSPSVASKFAYAEEASSNEGDTGGSFANDGAAEGTDNEPSDDSSGEGSESSDVGSGTDEGDAGSEPDESGVESMADEGDAEFGTDEGGAEVVTSEDDSAPGDEGESLDAEDADGETSAGGEGEDEEDLAASSEDDSEADPDESLCEASDGSSEESEAPEGSDPAHAREFAYEGVDLMFAKDDGTVFNVFTPQEGTSAIIDGDDVLITYVPKSTSVYGAFYLGADVTDRDTWDDSRRFALGDDGSYAITLPKSYCGYAWPVAPTKKSNPAATTSVQYYFFIPSSDKIPERELTAVELVQQAVSEMPADPRSVVNTGMTDEFLAAGQAYLALSDEERGQLTEDERIQLAKVLIAVLSSDPYDVTAEESDAIDIARSVFESLSSSAQSQLDEDAVSSSRTYGRYLENCVWALDALSEVDDSTTLADGTYTGVVESSTNMGKSNSRRAYGFTVKSITVKNGRATALVEHATSSSATLYIGGKKYDNQQTVAGKKSLYQIPIDLNSTFHFSAKGSGTNQTEAITYEMTTSVDEKNAKPDQKPSGGDNPSGEGGGGSGSGSGESGDGGSGSGSGGTAPSGDTPAGGSGGSGGSGSDNPSGDSGSGDNGSSGGNASDDNDGSTDKPDGNTPGDSSGSSGSGGKSGSSGSGSGSSSGKGGSTPSGSVNSGAGLNPAALAAAAQSQSSSAKSGKSSSSGSGTGASASGSPASGKASSSSSSKANAKTNGKSKPSSKDKGSSSANGKNGVAGKSGSSAAGPSGEDGSIAAAIDSMAEDVASGSVDVMPAVMGVLMLIFSTGILMFTLRFRSREGYSL